MIPLELDKKRSLGSSKYNFSNFIPFQSYIPFNFFDREISKVVSPRQP